MDETPIPEHPEVVIFASYRSTPKYPVKVSVLGENVSQMITHQISSQIITFDNDFKNCQVFFES